MFGKERGPGKSDLDKTAEEIARENLLIALKTGDNEKAEIWAKALARVTNRKPERPEREIDQEIGNVVSDLLGVLNKRKKK